MQKSLIHKYEPTSPNPGLTRGNLACDERVVVQRKIGYSSGCSEAIGRLFLLSDCILQDSATVPCLTCWARGECVSVCERVCGEGVLRECV